MARIKKLPEGAEKIETDPRGDGSLIAEAKAAAQARRELKEGREGTVGGLDAGSIRAASEALGGSSDAALILGGGQKGDPLVPKELVGLAGDGADANTILARGGPTVPVVRKSARSGDPTGRGPIKLGDPTMETGETDEAKGAPPVGTWGGFHSTARRAGRRDHDAKPAVVTKVRDDGKVSLTIFEEGRIHFARKVGTNKRADEYFVPNKG